MCNRQEAGGSPVADSGTDLVVRQALLRGWGRGILVSPAALLLRPSLRLFRLGRRRPWLRIAVLPFAFPAGAAPHRRHVLPRAEQAQEAQNLKGGETCHSQAPPPFYDYREQLLLKVLKNTHGGPQWNNG